LHLIAIDSSIITNLNKCFNKCQIEIAEVVAAIYATSSATLTKDEMKIGAILIDMGASSTSYGIFIDDKLLYLNHIPYGGLDITLNIARKFSLSIKDAERIKILYGNASPSLLLQNSAIKIDGSDKIITTVDLANILCDTITNLFQQIKAQCNELSMEIFNVNQVVLTGGSSTLAGLANLATDILEKQTRIAKPKAITGFAESANPHAESTILGMVNQQIMLSKNNIFKYDPQDNKSWWEKTLTWIKENI
jgi:cell division protein FtsA